MKRFSARRLHRFGAAILAIAVAAAVALPATAQSRRSKSKRTSQYVLDQRTGKQFLAIREALEAEQFDQVKRLLDKLPLDKMKPFPKALAYQTYGILATEADDFENAAKYFAKTLELEALPPSQQASIRFNLGQIYMMLDRWEDSIAALEKWFEIEENPRPSAYYMLGLAYYQADRHDEALAPAVKAYELADDPRETWITLPLALYMEKKEYKKAVPLLERLVLRYQKKPHFVQLAAVYSQLDREEDAFAVRQFAHAKGLLTTDSELNLLAQVYVYNGIPWQGAKILEKGLEDGSIEGDAQAWQLLANSLLAARENQRALEPLKQAASLADDGEVFVRLSQVHIQAERWAQAREALSQAFAKGGLKNPGHAHLLLGIAAFQEKRYGQARSAFARARGDEKTRDMAERWMQFVDREAAAAQAS